MILESIREELEYNKQKALYESIDVKELLEDYNEALDQQLELFLSILNNKNEYLNENNWWDDLNIKKEDLENPKVVTKIIQDIRDHKYSPEFSDQALNFLYGYLMISVGVGLGGPIGLIISIVLLSKKFDRFEGFIKKTEKGIKTLRSRIRTEEDPKMKKEYQNRLEILEKNKEKLEKARRGI